MFNTRGYTWVGIPDFPDKSPEIQIYQCLNVGFLQDRFEYYDSMNPQKLTVVYQDRCKELTNKIKSRDHPEVRYPNEEDIPTLKQDLIVRIIAMDRGLGNVESVELDMGRGRRNFKGGQQ